MPLFTTVKKEVFLGQLKLYQKMDLSLKSQLVSYRNMYKWTENGETLYTPHVPQNTGGIVLSSSSVLNDQIMLI
jgi:hypothetical protein